MIKREDLPTDQCNHTR